MDGQLLANVESDKLIGVMISKNLSWEEHIAKNVSTVNKTLALLRQIKNYLPISVRKTFFNAHILPHLDFCSTVWGSSPHVNTLLYVHKRAARMILDIKDTRAPENRSSMLFSKLGRMTIHYIIAFRKATMVYKSLNNLASPYMATLFKHITEIYNGQTRAATRNDLAMPCGIHKSIYDDTFYILLWFLGDTALDF